MRIEVKWGWGKLVGIWWAWVIKPKIGSFFNFYKFQRFFFSNFHDFLPIFLLHARYWLTYQVSYSIKIISLHFTCFQFSLSLSQLYLATPLSIIFANVKIIKWWLKEEKETKKFIFDARRREIVTAMAFLGLV